MNNEIAQLYQPLFLYVKKRINNVEDAEDITQEVFLKLSKSSNGKIKKIKNWVYAIAKNTITDFYRKKKILTNEVEDENIVGYFEEENNQGIELSNCIQFYINKLPNEYRELMILSEIKEIPQKEIADRMNMNYTTLRSKIQRGRKKLKKLFTDCCTVIQGGKGSIIDIEQKGNCNSSC